MRSLISCSLARLWLPLVWLGGSALELAEADDFTLQRTIDKMECSFRFEFVPLDWSEGTVLDRIVVTMPGKKRKQTLRVDFGVGEFTGERMKAAVRFRDLNGDGHEDLLVPCYSSPMGNSADYVWIYMPADGEFVYSPELWGQHNLKPDGKGGLATHSRDGGPNRTANKFRWTGKRFELVQTYQHLERAGQVLEVQRSKKDGKWVEDFSRPVEAQ